MAVSHNHTCCHIKELKYCVRAPAWSRMSNVYLENSAWAFRSTITWYENPLTFSVSFRHSLLYIKIVKKITMLFISCFLFECVCFLFRLCLHITVSQYVIRQYSWVSRHFSLRSMWILTVSFPHSVFIAQPLMKSNSCTELLIPGRLKPDTWNWWGEWARLSCVHKSQHIWQITGMIEPFSCSE